MPRHATIAAFLAALALPAQEPTPAVPVNPRLGEAATKAIDGRIERIRAELTSLGSKPGWAGRYYHGDGLGLNVVVDLAPTAGFALRWSGCAGTIDQDHGTCTERDGRIRLGSAFPAAPERGPLLPAEFVPVRWGERRYLITPAQLPGFANAINGGGEPRNGPHGNFLLRAGDESRACDGRPDLPPEAAALLLAEPVTGTITAVHDSKVEPSGTLRYRVTEATIDRGTTHGIKQGHVVHFRKGGFGITGGVVVEVGERTARIRIRCLLLDKVPTATPEPAPGWEWSTRGSD